MTTQTTPAEKLAELVQEHAAMLDPLDIPLSWTGQQLNDYEAKRALLNRRIIAISEEVPAIAGLTPQVTACDQWRNHLIAWRRTLRLELEDLGKPRTPEQTGKRQNLILSLTMIEVGHFPDDSGYMLETLRLGALMRASGFTEGTPNHGETHRRLPWNGGLSEVDESLKVLRERLDRSQRRLDDALLDDAEREQKAKEDLARTAALNALPQRKTRGDGSVYLKYASGKIEEVDLTAEVTS